MRQPTSEDDLLRWHREATAGHEPPMANDDPQCGWYRMQAVKHGPWLPVLIWVDREIDESGELTGPEEIRASVFDDPDDPFRVWTFVEPISRDAYIALRAERLRTQHIHDPRRAIDTGAAPTLP